MVAPDNSEIGSVRRRIVLRSGCRIGWPLRKMKKATHPLDNFVIFAHYWREMRVTLHLCLYPSPRKSFSLCTSARRPILPPPPARPSPPHRSASQTNSPDSGGPSFPLPNARSTVVTCCSRRGSRALARTSNASSGSRKGAFGSTSLPLAFTRRTTSTTCSSRAASYTTCCTSSTTVGT